MTGDFLEGSRCMCTGVGRWGITEKLLEHTESGMAGEGVSGHIEKTAALRTDGSGLINTPPHESQAS